MRRDDPLLDVRRQVSDRVSRGTLVHALDRKNHERLELYFFISKRGFQITVKHATETVALHSSNTFARRLAFPLSKQQLPQLVKRANAKIQVQELTFYDSTCLMNHQSRTITAQLCSAGVFDRPGTGVRDAVDNARLSDSSSRSFLGQNMSRLCVSRHRGANGNLKRLPIL